MKKSILLPAVMAVFMAVSFVSCSNGSDDSTNDTKGGNSSDGTGSSGISLTITYTSVKPDDVDTKTSGWIDCSKKYFSASGLYPSDVPSTKTVSATSEAAGYSASYTLTSDDLPELSHEFLTFTGWYDENDTKVSVGDPIYADTKLNARWEDGKKTGAIVYKKADSDVVVGSQNILGSAYTYSGNYNASYGTPVGILVVSKYALSDTVSYFIMNLNESSEKLLWAAENSDAAGTVYDELVDNGVTKASYGRIAYSTLTGTSYNLSADTIPAIKYCHDLTDNGLTWFLPSLSEINGLTDDRFELINNSLKTLNSNGITATELTTDSTEAEDNNDGVYWTSSISGSQEKVSMAWNLFKTGSAMSWSDYKTTAHRVRAFADVDAKFATDD